MEKTMKQISETWKKHVERRNAYTFGDEDISLSEFAELFRNTFEIIRVAKNEFIYKNTVPENPVVSLNYLELLATLSKYMTYDCVYDESEDKTFTATCLVAQKLVDYATSAGGFEIMDGISACVDNSAEKQGAFTFFRDDYLFCDDCADEEDDDRTYTYNVYDGDFEEILELTSQLSE